MNKINARFVSFKINNIKLLKNLVIKTIFVYVFKFYFFVYQAVNSNNDYYNCVINSLVIL